MHFLNIREPKPFVALVNPFRQNERLTAQQGLFLCPGDVSQPFMDNLFSPPTEPDEGGVYRIPIDAQIKGEAIEELRRMNVTSATFFPGLEGFSKSLADWFALDLPFNEKDLLDALHLPPRSKSAGYASSSYSSSTVSDR